MFQLRNRFQHHGFIQGGVYEDEHEDKRTGRVDLLPIK